MWKHCGAVVCAIVGLLLTTSAFIIASDDPSTLPLVQFGDLVYLGAFRLPDTFVNGDGFTVGGRPVAYNPEHNSLYIGSRAGHMAEVAIPTPVNSANINALPFASFLQGFFDPTEGNMWQIATDGAAIDGILVHGDRLYGTGSIYYDANNTQRVSHYSRSKTLSTPSFVGMSQVWQADRTGFVSGYMANVPTEWQAKLGGPAITGQCCLPIAWRTSWGPSAFAWNPQDIGAVSPVPAVPLLYYHSEHPTLGHWDGSGPIYGGTTQVNGLAIIAGTRTALFFGRNGTGPFCYGNGTSVESLAGTIGPDNEVYCYDPSSPAKGQHAYPYQYQLWAYDLNDLAAVKAGTKQPWDVLPYGVWPFTLPTPEATVRIGGIGYDSSNQIIYVSQLLADQDGYGYRPIIHALKVGAVSGAPAPTPAPSPTPTSKATSVALTANVPAPQPPGSTITWTAVPTGGVAPHQYKWWTYDGATWTPIGTWTASNSFAWTPTTVNTASRVAVWVRSAGNTVDDQETSTAVSFAISGTAAPPPTTAPSPTARASAVALTATKVAPQPPGTTITWSAVPSGGVAPYQYKWWIYDGASWIPSGTWTTSGSLAWTPATANANYRVAVWVRSAGNTVDEQETSTAVSFAISGTATATPPPATATPTARATAVALLANLVAPQPPGTTVTWSAIPTGGVAPHQYKWWTYDGASWVATGTWTASSTFAWTPATANANYRVAVWVRSAGNTVDDQEVSTAVSFAISGTAATAPPPAATTPSSAKVTAVTLTAAKTAPQAAGTTIQFNAAPVSGVAPYQYKWWIFDGASWASSGAWTASSTFAWTPSAVSAGYRIAVWARSAHSSADAAEASAALDFPISATAPATSTSTSVTAVMLSVDKIAPQPPGSTVTWTATPTGGVAPHQYKFYMWDGTTWTVLRGWGTSNTLSWTPTMANQDYKVAVWVKSSGNTADAQEASASVPFAILNGATATTTATTTTTATARVSALTVAADRVAPQAPGVTTTFTAQPSGGTGPLQYKWWIYDGQTWMIASTWTTSGTFAWTAPSPNAAFKIGVWVKSAGNGADQGESTASIAFPIQ